MNTDIENYFVNGCMRCDLGGTQDCKVHAWSKELELARAIIRTTGVEEEVKWGVPCYTYQGSNVLILSALKNYVSIGFFRGSLLSDEEQLLEKPGKNSQAVRLFKLTSIKQIEHLSEFIREYIFEAIELEKSGIKVEFKKSQEPMPAELEDRLENDAVLKSAFEALTPGRQRGYIIYFSGAKQAKTRYARIDKWTDKILNGEGMHDKYQSKKS